jgi:hypothetical protein
MCVALACAALCILLLYSLWREEEPMTEAAPAGIVRPATQSSSAPPAIFQGFWLAQTPAQVRAVVRFCREAVVADAAGLRSVALSSPDPLVAGNALRALGRLGAVARDSELVALVRDPRPRVRQEVVLALGASGYTPVVEDLAPLLERDDLVLRPLVLQALGWLAGARAGALLESVLRDRAATEVDRAFARQALVLIQESAAVAERLPEPLIQDSRGEADRPTRVRH